MSSKIEIFKEKVAVITQEIRRDNGQVYLFLWKMGSLENKIYPTEESVNKLKDIVSKWDGESDFHIVWNDALDVQMIELS